MKKVLMALLVVALLMALAACGGNSNELSGTYVDEETESVYLVFVGDEVSYISSEGSMEGTYVLEDGFITFGFRGDTPYGNHPLSFSIEDNGAKLIIDGIVYIRQNAAAQGGSSAQGDDTSSSSGDAVGGGNSSFGADSSGDGISSDELVGTFLEETGSVSLTFDGNGKVILDFPTEDYSAEGTYETADGSLTFHFDEYTPMGDRPVPYEVNETGLVLDGTLYVRQ